MATPAPETSIWLALKAQVESLSLSPALTVAYPNEDFTPPSSSGVATNYLRVFQLRNENETVTLGTTGTTRHFGILQISLICQKDKNIAIATEIAGDIAEHFKLNTVLLYSGIYVRVERPPVVGSLITNPSEPMAEIPISIRYQADTQRS